MDRGLRWMFGEGGLRGGFRIGWEMDWSFPPRGAYPPRCARAPFRFAKGASTLLLLLLLLLLLGVGGV